MLRLTTAEMKLQKLRCSLLFRGLHCICESVAEWLKVGSCLCRLTRLTVLFLYYNVSFIEGMNSRGLNRVLDATAQLTALRSLRVRNPSSACRKQALLYLGSTSAHHSSLTASAPACPIYYKGRMGSCNLTVLGSCLGMMCLCVVQLTVPPEWNEQTEINGAAWAMILALPKLSSVVFVVTVDEPATADREVGGMLQLISRHSLVCYAF